MDLVRSPALLVLPETKGGNLQFPNLSHIRVFGVYGTGFNLSDQLEKLLLDIPKDW